jgi:hypothetical protein
MKTPDAAVLLPIAIAAGAANAQDRPNERPPWPPRGYACVPALAPPEIDGLIEQSEWSDAPWSEAFIDILGDRMPAPRHATRMRMMWDDECLYVAAALDEPHVWATLTERDSVIFHDNDFEVFIDPSGDTQLYAEIEINALNTVWDLLLVRTYDDGGPAVHAWDIPGLRTAVRIDGTINDPADIDAGWTVEMAIPWAPLAEIGGVPCPPRAGDRWRMNFSRVQWRLDIKDGAYRKRADPASGEPLAEDNWVWSEQRAIAMHEPEYWGIVEFRAAPDGPAVEPTDTDRAVWALRQVFRAVRRDQQERGAPPDRIDQIDGVEAILEAHQPQPDWVWPPAYTRAGDRWTLQTESRTTGAVVRVLENGRILRLAGE